MVSSALAEGDNRPVLLIPVAEAVLKVEAYGRGAVVLILSQNLGLLAGVGLIADGFACHLDVEVVLVPSTPTEEEMLTTVRLLVVIIPDNNA